MAIGIDGLNIGPLRVQSLELSRLTHRLDPTADAYSGAPPVFYGPNVAGVRRDFIHPRQIQPAEWTFFTYLAADNDLAPFALQNLAQMQNVGSLPGRLNLIVLADVAPSAGDAWSVGTRLLYLQKNANGQGASIKEISIDPRTELGVLMAKNRGRLNTGDPAVLRAAVEYVQRNVPSERFFLNLWNHGSSWRGIAYDTDADDHIDIAAGELASALQGLPIDGLGADACLTATLEVAEVLDGLHISVLVGSPEIEPGSGWNYADVLQRLSKFFELRQQVDPMSIAGALVRSYAAAGNSVLSSTRLGDYFQWTAQAVDGLARHLIEAGGLLHNADLRRVYDESLRYADEQMDLGDFCHRLEANFTGPIEWAAQDVLRALDAAMKVETGQAQYRPSKGLSIYAPRGGVDPAYEQPGAAWKDRTWGKLLRTFADPQPMAIPIPWGRLRPHPPEAARQREPNPNAELTQLLGGQPGPYASHYNLVGAIHGLRFEDPIDTHKEAGIEIWGRLVSGPADFRVEIEREDTTGTIKVHLSATREDAQPLADHPHDFHLHVPLPISFRDFGDWRVQVTGQGLERSQVFGYADYANAFPREPPPHG